MPSKFHFHDMRWAAYLIVRLFSSIENYSSHENRVPVAVVIKAAGLFEDAGELHAARAHVVNVGAGGFVAVFKGALLLGLAPEDFVVAVGVEGRVNVNQIHAGVWQLGELFQIVAAINDAGVHQRARTWLCS